MNAEARKFFISDGIRYGIVLAKATFNEVLADER